MKIIVEFKSPEGQEDEIYERRFMAALAKIKSSKYKIINKIPTGGLTFDVIEKLVCDHTSKVFFMDINPDLISKVKRKREVVVARQLCYYISKNKCLGSWAKIGDRFGHKDHATAMHGHKTINNLLQTNVGFRNDFQQFIESFK